MAKVRPRPGVRGKTPGLNLIWVWFYERVRGQYLYEQGRAGTPARKKRFRELYPATQRFSKTDIGKFINSWHRLPHVVSLGAQKNFMQFMVAAKEEPAWNKVESLDFTRIVALAILFKRTDQLVQQMDLGGYKANIVTYSIAYLAHATGGRLDLDRIWKDQKLSPVIEQAIIAVAQEAKNCITTPPGAKNIGEWCKERKCWEALRARHIDLGATFRKLLVPAEIALPASEHEVSKVSAVAPKIPRVGKIAAK